MNARDFWDAVDRNPDRYAVQKVFTFVGKGITGIAYLGWSSAKVRDFYDGADRALAAREAFGKLIWKRGETVARNVYGPDAEPAIRRALHFEVKREFGGEVELSECVIAPRRDVPPQGIALGGSTRRRSEMPKKRTEMNAAGKRVWALLEAHVGLENAVPTARIAAKLGVDEGAARAVIAANKKFFPRQVAAKARHGYYVVPLGAGETARAKTAPEPEHPNRPLMLRRPAPKAQAPALALAGEEPSLAGGYKITISGAGLSVQLDAAGRDDDRFGADMEWAQRFAEEKLDAHVERLLAARGRLARLQKLERDERERAARLTALEEKTAHNAAALEATRQKIDRLKGEIAGQALLPGVEAPA